MIPREGEWRGYWEEHGTRVDDDKSVPIRVGVLDVDGQLSLAISVACAVPVVITSRTAAGLAELMQWAQDEHEMLTEQRQQPHTERVDDAPDKAILTHRQWQSILDAFMSEDPSDVTGAVATLRTAAPHMWTSRAAEKPDDDVAIGAEVRQLIACLDDVDAQLNHIVTQLHALRGHLAPRDVDSAPERPGEPAGTCGRCGSAKDDSPGADTGG